jgi:hypothetical protein
VPALPLDVFVFGTFSNFQKIDPVVFDVWCAILRRVRKSVLWIVRHDAADVRVEAAVGLHALAAFETVAFVMRWVVRGGGWDRTPSRTSCSAVRSAELPLTDLYSLRG